MRIKDIKLQVARPTHAHIYIAKRNAYDVVRVRLLSKVEVDQNAVEIHLEVVLERHRLNNVRVTVRQQKVGNVLCLDVHNTEGQTRLLALRTNTIHAAQSRQAEAIPIKTS